MRRLTTLTALCLLLITSGSIRADEAAKTPSERAKVASTTPAASGEDARLRKMVEAHVARFNAGDWKGIRDEFASDALLMHQFSPNATGLEAIATLFKDDFKEIADSKMNLSLAARVDETQIFGGWAFTRGLYTFTATNDGTTRSREVRFLEIMQKQADGSWKVARSIDNTSEWPK